MQSSPSTPRRSSVLFSASFSAPSVATERPEIQLVSICDPHPGSTSAQPGRSPHHDGLDGDNVHHGLNKDLGFTEADRVENIRRADVVAKLMVEGGLIVLCSLISPNRAVREMVRGLFDDGEFIEVFVDAPIEDYMRRDPKGFYAKAKAGKLKNFIGADAPYRAPERPEIHLQARYQSPEELAATVLGVLSDRGIVETRYSSRSHPRVFEHPEPIHDAWQQVCTWLKSETTWIPQPHRAAR